MGVGDEVRELGLEFWRWRATQQPRPRDDIPRIERPPGWVPDWSATAVAAARTALGDFERRQQALDVSSSPVPVQVDRRLIGSAIARVRWELEHVRSWEKNANFYVDQTIGTVYDVLLSSRPWDQARVADLLRLTRHCPTTLAHAKENLADNAVGPFAAIAINELEGIGDRVDATIEELRPYIPAGSHGELSAAAREMVAALEEYSGWLGDQLAEMDNHVGVGRESFEYFLSEVALLPYTPEEMVAMAQQEAERATLFELTEAIRNRDVPDLPLPATAEEQVERQRRDELSIRAFYEERNLLSQPETLRHYLTSPMPPYIEPLTFLGVTNDLTGPSRLSEDAVNYVPQPQPDMGFFFLAHAKDPRTGIFHEGAHYQQLALAWAHEDPLRRYYYDSGPNEGIAFYNEELLLQAGLFDDSPRTREIVYRFLRLRALRVEFDIGLATGGLDVDAAIAYLVEKVPMDVETARWETGFLSAIPGVALTYQIGKLQLLHFLSAAIALRGPEFDLRSFHDYLWKNGNVPFALLRWEYLGLRDEIDRVDAARARRSHSAAT